MKFKKIACLILGLIMMMSILGGCDKDEKSFEKLEDYENSVLGVVVGSIYDGYSREMFPNAKIDYYQIFPDLFGCLKQGKVDGFMLDQPNFNAVRRENKSIAYIDIPQYDVEIGYAFQKNNSGATLQAQMNELLDSLKADGSIDTLIEKWYGEKEPVETFELPDLSDNPNKLKVAVDAGRKPFVYMRDGEYVGFEIEVFYMFCEKYAYNPTIENISFASGIAGLGSGKYDLVSGGIYMTPERKESINFSDPYMYANVVMVTSAADENNGFWAGIKEGFKKTFVDESRWKLVASGIATTLIITFASAIFGSALGFLVYMLCRRFGKFAKGITKVFTVILGGTPIVVVLMILYYVVFGNFDISGVVISIIGFSLTVASFVYENLTVCVDSIDGGQREAALAMGFTDNGGFFNIILPQAMKTFLPVYGGEMVSLIKGTAVVGYIAVQDLTRMSDLIRSNTFEAFFPLVATAIIYLLLSFAISGIVKYIRYKAEPRNRTGKKILKGTVSK